MIDALGNELEALIDPTAAHEIYTAGLALTLVSADLDLNTAAIAEGLVVDDPNTH